MTTHEWLVLLPALTALIPLGQGTRFACEARSGKKSRRGRNADDDVSF